MDNLKPYVVIVRCKECKWYKQSEAFCENGNGLWQAGDDCFCSYGEPSSSEKPNNCEHITEDGVTCAKYPACDGCLDNPLNKVKGSERLLKGKDEPQTDEHCNTCRHKDECEGATYEYKNTEWWCLAYAPIDEPQTDCAWK